MGMLLGYSFEVLQGCILGELKEYLYSNIFQEIKGNIFALYLFLFMWYIKQNKEKTDI